MDIENFKEIIIIIYGKAQNKNKVFQTELYIFDEQYTD